MTKAKRSVVGLLALLVITTATAHCAEFPSTWPSQRPSGVPAREHRSQVQERRLAVRSPRGRRWNWAASKGTAGSPISGSPSTAKSARSPPRAGAADLLGRRQKPAVECPLGDFFGLGFGRYVEYKSAPIAIGGVKALNCYWPMPFAKGARADDDQRGQRTGASCYFNIDYRLDDRPAADIRYFHTQYRQAFPVPKGEDYLILETAGRGHFVGTFLSVMANSDGWWGEGNDKFYVDGADEAHHRRHGQRGLFLRGTGTSSMPSAIPITACPFTTTGERGRETRHPQYLLPLAHPRSGAVQQIAADDHRARPNGPGRRSQAVEEPLRQRRLLLSGLRRGRRAGFAAVQGARTAPAATARCERRFEEAPGHVVTLRSMGGMPLRCVAARLGMFPHRPSCKMPGNHGRQ